jgi:hypothetical protein
MKKWMYLVFPGAMLGLFLVFFLSHTKEAEAREKARQEVLAKKIADDAAKKKADEERARADAEKRAAERAAEDAKKEADKIAKQAAIDREIKEATDKALAEAASSQKTIDSLEAELDRAHKQRDQLSRDGFNLAKQVELAKVARRNAEIEIQRTVELIARKAQESYLVRMPPPPPPPPAK